MSGGGFNLGRFIPSFEDDPKARFMDEIAHTTNSDVVKSPVRKRAKKAADEIFVRWRRGAVRGRVNWKR